METNEETVKLLFDDEDIRSIKEYLELLMELEKNTVELVPSK